MNALSRDEYELPLVPSVEEVASEVAAIIARQITAKDILKLLQIIFLEKNEVAALLRVEPTTISTWISKGVIPVRYANGKPVFLLSEIMNWTLPDNDKHVRYRLVTAQQVKLAAAKLSSVSPERGD